MSTDRTTEILNYLTAISREVGEMRSEMQRRFDGLESDVKEIKRDLKLLREDIHRVRLDHEETKERVTALEER
jgi:chromosome segregation ATPase